MSDTHDTELRKHLSDQASEMDGASWISVPLSDMSQQELLGVIAHMRRIDERSTKCYRERLEFLVGTRRSK